MLYKVLLWGFGQGYNQNVNVVRYQEMLGTIKVIGITDKKELYVKLDSYKVIKLQEITKIEFDYIVVTSDYYFNEICEEAKELGIGRNKILPIRIFNLPRFDFGKYVELLESKVSIIANLCWGGITYHSLGMEFMSPFINLYILEQDYLRLLENLKYYLGCDLKFVRWEYNSGAGNIDFPVCALDDVKLYFNHYHSFDEAEKSWYKRCSRINWNNLFILLYTNNKESLMRFEKLKFEKKICFVPFESNLDSADTIHFSDHQVIEKNEWWSIVNGLATSSYYSYDILELLIKGKPNYARME